METTEHSTEWNDEIVKMVTEPNTTYATFCPVPDGRDFKWRILSSAAYHEYTVAGGVHQATIRRCHEVVFGNPMKHELDELIYLNVTGAGFMSIDSDGSGMLVLGPTIVTCTDAKYTNGNFVTHYGKFVEDRFFVEEAKDEKEPDGEETVFTLCVFPNDEKRWPDHKRQGLTVSVTHREYIETVKKVYGLR